jgi:hypothetical protein
MRRRSEKPASSERRCVTPRPIGPLAMIACLLVVGPGVVIGAESDDPAAKAASEIEAARDRANAAATAYFEAESQIDQLAIEKSRLERERDQLAREVDRLRGDVSAVTVEQFVSAASGGIPILTGGTQDQKRQAQLYRSLAIDASAGSLDDFDEAR